LRQHVPPKTWLSLNGLHGAISLKMEPFITVNESQIRSAGVVKDKNPSVSRNRTPVIRFVTSHHTDKAESSRHWNLSSGFTCGFEKYCSWVSFGEGCLRVTDKETWVCSHDITVKKTQHTRTQSSCYVQFRPYRSSSSSSSPTTFVRIN
jgi:hypothetical protein